MPTTYICCSLRVHHSLYFLAFSPWRNFHNVIYLFATLLKSGELSNFAQWIFQTTLISKSFDDEFIVFSLSHKEGLFKGLSRTAFDIMNLRKWRPFIGTLYDFYSAANYWSDSWKGKSLQLFSLWSPRTKDGHAAAFMAQMMCVGSQEWRFIIWCSWYASFVLMCIKKHLHSHPFVKFMKRVHSPNRIISRKMFCMKCAWL